MFHPSKWQRWRGSQRCLLWSVEPGRIALDPFCQLLAFEEAGEFLEVADHGVPVVQFDVGNLDDLKAVVA